MRSFLSIPDNHPFSLHNLPYGVFRRKVDRSIHAGIAVGNLVLDLAVLQEKGLLDVVELADTRPFDQPSLNAFMAMGAPVWQAVRRRVLHLLDAQTPTLRDAAEVREQVFLPIHEVEMQLPARIGDYTDFYASKYHAENVGRLFRGPDQALRPNWVHLPIAYHGRASSIVVSGTDIVRPWGQLKSDDGPPRLAPTRKLDFELELGFFVGPGNAHGASIPVERAGEHIFGFVLVNDWSARDIQQWEYVPLGPFLGKNFATSISPWVVPMEALVPFRCAGPVQDPEPLPYLHAAQPRAFDIELEVTLQASEAETPRSITRTNTRHLYWSPEQMVAHHTVNGCNLRPGDLLASGTISGPMPGSVGSLLERSGEAGARFLEDGDRVTLTGWARGEDYRVGFGFVTGRVQLARITG